MEIETLLTLPLLQDAHRQWERLIAKTGHSARHKSLNFDRSALALDAAIGGHGVAIAPTYMVEEDIHAKRLVKIWVNPEACSKHLFMAWSREHTGQRSVARVADWIAAEFA